MPLLLAPCVPSSSIILGHALEKSTGFAYSELLHKCTIEPLNLNRTFYVEEPFDNNTAKSYTTLKDGSFYEVPPWGRGKNLLMGAAGAVRSSISDLLVLYKALINDANSQVALSSVSEAKGVLEQLPQLLQSKSGVPNHSLREYSYASGWIRTQLPAIVDLFAESEPPLLEGGPASRLMIHHQVYIAANVGYVALFPEKTSAVVVLGNSAGLTDAMRLLGQVIVETVLGNEVDAGLYLNTAIAATKKTIASVNEVHKELLAGKTVDQPTRDITVYRGRYYNAIENSFIDVIKTDGRLQVAYMGFSRDTFDLTPYESDSFFWWLDFDESAKRARLPEYPSEYLFLSLAAHQHLRG